VIYEQKTDPVHSRVSRIVSGRKSGASKWRSAGCRCRVRDYSRRWCHSCECVVRLWPLDAAHNTAVRWWSIRGAWPRTVVAGTLIRRTGRPSSTGSVWLLMPGVSSIKQKVWFYYSGAVKSLAWPVRKTATATEDFDVHISYNHNWRNISTIYIYNKTSIKRNILIIKQNTSGSRLYINYQLDALIIIYS